MFCACFFCFLFLAFSYFQDNFTHGCVTENIQANARIFTEIPIGYDAIVVILQQNSSLWDCIDQGGLTFDNLTSIFSSNVTSWDEALVGCGVTDAIEIYIPNTDEFSGTSSYFADTVLMRPSSNGSIHINSNINQMGSWEEVINAVSIDPLHPK